MKIHIETGRFSYVLPNFGLKSLAEGPDLERLDDLPRHRAHIGPAVASYLRDVVQATHREAEELPPGVLKRVSNGL